MFHISVTDSEIAHKSSKVLQKQLCLFTLLQIRHRYDFKKGCAGSIEIKKQHISGMHHFPHILFEMHFTDRYPFFSLPQLNVHVTGCPDRRSEFFIEGTLPEAICPAGHVAGARDDIPRATRRQFFEWLRRHL